MNGVALFETNLHLGKLDDQNVVSMQGGRQLVFEMQLFAVHHDVVKLAEVVFNDAGLALSFERRGINTLQDRITQASLKIIDEDLTFHPQGLVVVIVFNEGGQLQRVTQRDRRSQRNNQEGKSRQSIVNYMHQTVSVQCFTCFTCLTCFFGQLELTNNSVT